MTELTITPDITKKCATISGRIAAGEHIAVTLVGMAEKKTSTLYLRVIAGQTTIAMFPEPVEDGETQAEWTVSGNDLTCELNLNTVQALAQCRAPETYCLFSLEEIGDSIATPELCPQLYFIAPHPVLCWPKRKPSDTPFDFDDYPSTFKTWQWQISNIAASVTKSGTTATISITDKNGVTTTATISDGATGEKGDTGASGADGVSPTVTTEAITGGHRIIITDATHTETVDVLDGEGGGTTDYNNLDNKPQIGGVTLEGNKAAADLITPTDIGALAEDGVAVAASMVMDSAESPSTIGIAHSKDTGEALAVLTDGTTGDAKTLATTDDVPTDEEIAAVAKATKVDAATSADEANALYSLDGLAVATVDSDRDTLTITHDGGTVRLADAEDIPYKSASEVADRRVAYYKVETGLTLSITLPEIPSDTEAGTAVINCDIVVDAVGVTELPTITITGATPKGATAAQTIYAVDGTMPEFEADALNLVSCVSVPALGAWVVLAATKLTAVAQ